MYYVFRCERDCAKISTVKHADEVNGQTVQDIYSSKPHNDTRGLFSKSIHRGLSGSRHLHRDNRGIDNA